MTYKPYPKYKATGVEWLGNVPEEWQMLPLFTVLHERQTKNEGNGVQNVLSLSYGRIVDRDVESNHGLLPESFETYQIVEQNDVILRLTDLQNDQRSLRVGQVRRRGIITSAYTCLIPSERIAPAYAYLLLHAYDTLKIFYGLGGGVRQSMKFDDLKRLSLAIPPKDEQVALASFLDRETAKIDTLIAKQEKLIELLTEKRQAVISHAVTKGLNPAAPMKPSGVEWLSDVPEHWALIPVKHLVTMSSGGTPSKDREDYWGGRHPWASAKDLKVEVLSDTEDHISDKAIEEGAATLVASGAVLIVVRGMILLHTLPVTVNAVPMAINQDLKALRASSNLLPSYLALLLRGLSREILRRTDQAAHGTKALRMDDWTGMQVPLPPLDEQRAILRQIEHRKQTIDQLIAKAEQAIGLQKEHRTALISAAVTGKIDVREAAMEVELAA